MTAEEFLKLRFELPEAGQWSELEAGEAVHLQPPDVDHGTVVLNLSKALAICAGQGYACFDLGLQLQSNPDTVRFPAACYFEGGPLFAESDRPIASRIPALVIELASTNDRRRRQPERSQHYLEWGVPCVWTIDPRLRTVEVYQRDAAARVLQSSDWLVGTGNLSPLNLQVATLFTEPSWWNAKTATSGKNGREV